ncbi:MAG: diguanylate cyclase [bacterium]|nr:diguanylate cyclase [bacterium]
MGITGHRPSSERGAFIVDRRGNILGFDQEMENLTGWPAVDVVGRHKSLGASPSVEDAPGATAGLPLYDGEIAPVQEARNVDLTLHARDGRSLEVTAVADPLPGPGDRIRVRMLHVLARSAPGAVRDVQDKHDPLTGLPTADVFAAQLGRAFRSAELSAQPLAVVLVDIDHLREINDRAGHGCGDEILHRLAGILRVAAPENSSIARLGDDDFAILLPRAGRGEARQLAAGLRSTVERYRFCSTEDGVARKVTLSLGAASYPADAEKPADLMDRARDALDEARTMGRNRVWCYVRRPRVPVEVPVFFDGADSLFVGYTRDLSPSGIFVQTAMPMDIGMRCALAFPLPGKGNKVHVIARVVRTVPSDHEGAEIRIPGMGVEFERFSGTGDRRAVESFLHTRESTTLRPENGMLST